jgi:hypothetical protein
MIFKFIFKINYILNYSIIPSFLFNIKFQSILTIYFERKIILLKNNIKS